MPLLYDEDPEKMARDLYGDAAWDLGTDRPERVPDITDPSVNVADDPDEESS